MIMKSTPESVVSNSAPVKNQLSLFTWCTNVKVQIKNQSIYLSIYLSVYIWLYSPCEPLRFFQFPNPKHSQ
jgi:hypothetical protein